MDAKTIVAVVLVAFIIGGLYSCRLRTERNKEHESGRSENFAHGSFTEVHYEQAKDG